MTHCRCRWRWASMHVLLFVSNLKSNSAGCCICLQDTMPLAPYCNFVMTLASVDVFDPESAQSFSLADIHVLVASDKTSILGLQACQYPLSAGPQLHQYPFGLSLRSCCGGSLQTPPASGRSLYAAGALACTQTCKFQSLLLAPLLWAIILNQIHMC